MTWEEFQEAERHLNIQREQLFMEGVIHDNSTRYLLNQKGEEYDNDKYLLDGGFGSLEDRDFVWNGRKVRVMGMIETGGHPALAGFDPVYCAGRIMEGYFFFHSGHFHPKERHALAFFIDLVNNTCRDLAGAERDAEVAELVKIKLRIYKDASEHDTYTTTFEEIVGPRIASTAVVRASSSSPSSSRLSSPPPPLRRQDSRELLESERIELTGMSSYVTHQLSTHGRPPCVDSRSAVKCASCRKDFGTFRRKHYCRQCGNVVCGTCSSKKKPVNKPMLKKGEDPNKLDGSTLRVCNTCWGLQRL